MIELSQYRPSDQHTWDTLISNSKNSTFLFKRGFMDYHSERFSDSSLLFSKKGTVIGCFPANYDKQNGRVYSHQGLTYGGIVIDKSSTSEDVLDILELLRDYYKSKFNARELIYKALPQIYSSYPSEEALYGLFCNNAILTSRNLSSTIDLSHPLNFTELRRRCIQKGNNAGLKVFETVAPQDIEEYWQILYDCLQKNHNVKPVHSPAEMQLLSGRFPNNISLIISKDPDDKIVAGCWVFKCGRVLHTQYLASSEKGRKNGALDLVISELISTYSTGFKYLDFGISTEQDGYYLNKGLEFQKEGFGGRGICYDTYKLIL